MDKNIKRLLRLHDVLEFSDWLSTLIALKMPGSTAREGNPIVRPIVEKGRWDILLLLKIGAMRWVRHSVGKEYTNNPSGAKKRAIAVNAMLSIVVINNTAIILKALNKKRLK